MLTSRQASLFRALDWNPMDEKEIRARHKEVVQKYGAVKDFTSWLTKVLHNRWKEERRLSSVYLGD